MDWPDLDWSDLQWGDVPSWFAAGSLILGVLIYFGDRRDRVRAQIDRLAVWGELTGGKSEIAENQDIVDATVDVRGVVKNPTELPVRVLATTWLCESTWGVLNTPEGATRHGITTRSPAPGTAAERFSSLHPFVVRPGGEQALTSRPQFAHRAPHPRARLWHVNPVVVEAECLLVQDNAGRRWILRPSAGGRAVRYRRWARWRNNTLPPGWRPRPVLKRLVARFHRGATGVGIAEGPTE